MEGKVKLKVYRVRENAKLPVRAHKTDAGMDLFYCPEDNKGTTLKVLLRMFQRLMHRVEGTQTDSSRCNFCSPTSRQHCSDEFFKWYDERYN